MNLSDYVLWNYRDEGNSCMLVPPSGLDRDWELYEGVAMASRFPPDITLQMSDDHKRNVGLTDNLMNLGTLIVASEPLAALLRARGLKNVEYLPVTVLNHKRQVASSTYAIVHPIAPQNCLDIQQSGCTYSQISPGEIIEVDQLVIDPARVDPSVALFRIKNFGFPVLVRRDLATEIEDAGFKGVLFSELDEYGQ